MRRFVYDDFFFSVRCLQNYGEALLKKLKASVEMLDKAIKYYKEKSKYISIVGIWHTSRGTEFVA